MSSSADAGDGLPDVVGVVDVADEILVVGLLCGGVVEQQLPVIILFEAFEDGLPDRAARTCE